MCVASYFLASDAVTATFKLFQDDNQLRTVEIGLQYEIV